METYRSIPNNLEKQNLRELFGTKNCFYKWVIFAGSLHDFVERYFF